MKDIEKSVIETIYKEGETSNYKGYRFGTKMGKGVFLGIRKNEFDVWLTTSIELENVSIE